MRTVSAGLLSFLSSLCAHLLLISQIPNLTEDTNDDDEDDGDNAVDFDDDDDDDDVDDEEDCSELFLSPSLPFFWE